MPRSTQSVEEKILDYFKTADVAAASVVLSFAKKTLDERRPKPVVAQGSSKSASAKKPGRPVGSGVKKDTQANSVPTPPLVEVGPPPAN